MLPRPSSTVSTAMMMRFCCAWAAPEASAKKSPNTHTSHHVRLRIIPLRIFPLSADIVLTQTLRVGRCGVERANKKREFSSRRSCRRASARTPSATTLVIRCLDRTRGLSRGGLRRTRRNIGRREHGHFVQAGRGGTRLAVALAIQNGHDRAAGTAIGGCGPSVIVVRKLRLQLLQLRLQRVHLLL